MDGIYWFAVGCGIVALLYGIYAIRSVLAASVAMSACKKLQALFKKVHAPT